MPPILDLVVHACRYEDAVAEISQHGTESTLRFSPEGFSVTAEVDGRMVSAVRFLAGGCERFSCSESRSARLNRELRYQFFKTFYDGLEEKLIDSALSNSIEIDPTGADSSTESDTEIEEGLSPATLTFSWFDPPYPAGQKIKKGDYKVSLRRSKVENGTPLLKYDESMYEAAAGLSPAGINRLDRKLKDLMKQDGRTEEGQIRVVILLTPAMLGFFTSRTGWFHGEKEGDDSVEVFRKGVEDMRFGVYRVVLLRQHIHSANTVNAARLCIHIQDGLPILLSCPIIDGDLGTLYFCCTDPPPYHTQLLAFDFVKNFL